MDSGLEFKFRNPFLKGCSLSFSSSRYLYRHGPPSSQQSNRRIVQLQHRHVPANVQIPQKLCGRLSLTVRKCKPQEKPRTHHQKDPFTISGCCIPRATGIALSLALFTSKLVSVGYPLPTNTLYIQQLISCPGRPPKVHALEMLSAQVVQK